MVKLNELETLEKTITKRRNKALDRQGYISLLGRILMLGLIAYLLLTQVFVIAQANGNDMFPAVKDGDVMFGYRLEQDYMKDDVVIYERDGQLHCGRVVAKGNDVVSIDEDGTVMVNGTTQSGEIMYPTYINEDSSITYPYTVSENCVFILGDYRTKAEDSRYFGEISLNDVEGKVITILRRRGL